ncbi:MAG: gamma-glutamyltransferase [Dehalococcoidia bacterium]|nr:gamma-glutamyltransferase [Dehalococcoidia bacterium]MQG01140.1 gamma-glutamyltransferase [SAR202 cluster bacterium]|tara:strand:- start:412 stop:2073 length:1662 start_codon:yes stop_codon:yes gene_type:complete
MKTLKQEAIGSRGVVTSNHALASLAGIEMLATGGNAVDAAVATVLALTVVEPMMVGITGAGFVNIHNASTNSSITIDNYCTAPAAAQPDMFTPISDSWPDYMETEQQKNKIGHLSVGVPAGLQCWYHIQTKYGNLDFENTVQPAMRYAEQGFSISPYLAGIIETNKIALKSYPGSRDLFFNNNNPLSTGQLLRNQNYASVLREISKTGDEILTRGWLGNAIEKEMAKNGGIVTQDDIEKYQLEYRNPVKGNYRGYEIVGVGPASSGATHIVQALNLLEKFNIEAMGFGTKEYIHLLAETLKIVFSDRFRFMGDPDFVDVPVQELVSKRYADIRYSEIDLQKAGSFVHGNPELQLGESENTTHLTVADNDGNIVSMTQTLNDAFGSRVTVPGTGVTLNNTLYNFDPHPGNANSIVPGKRVLSSMAPITVFKGGKPFMALGTPGGRRIFGSVLQGIINVIDHGMSLQQAVEAPRVWTQGQNLELEFSVSDEASEGLDKMGHSIERVDRIAGGMNGIMFDSEGFIHGAACWRADGSPVGLSGGQAYISQGDGMFRI